MNIVLYQPDIAQNLGSIIRLCACMGAKLHVIEPCGFPMNDKRMRRASLDYIDHVDLVRHLSWDAFLDFRRGHDGKLYLLTTKATTSYTAIAYGKNDMLMFGRESAGVPQAVHDAADEALTIPLQPGLRSLNVAMAAGMVLGEAIRQTE